MNRVIHVGLHKTGSTFLQRAVFPNLQNVSYFGNNYSLNRGTIVGTNETTILFSNEAACGYPYPSAQTFDVHDRLGTNVKVLQPNKMILVTREFHSWVRSLYFQTLNEGKSWDIEEWVSLNKQALMTWVDCQEKVSRFCSAQKIELLTLRYEDLKQNPLLFVKQICEFLDVPVPHLTPTQYNASRYGYLTIELYRGLNSIFSFRPLRYPLRAMRITPRRLIQSGGIGAIADKLSKKSLTSLEVARLLS